MIQHSDSSSSSEGSFSRGGRGSGPSSDYSLHNSRWRFVPFIWQLGGGAVTVAGFAAGTNSLSEVGLHLSILSFATAVFLSLFIRDRRRPQDVLAVGGYLLYAFGFAFLSAPSWWALGTLARPLYALGVLCIASLLPLTWGLFVEYLME